MNQPVAESSAAPAARRPASRWFFVGMSTLLLAILAVGFARTFFLREYFGTARLSPGLQTLPVYLYVHGVVLTAWFVLFFAQTALVASHRTDLHRRLGVSGAALAVVVIFISLIVVIRAVARAPANLVPAAQVPGNFAGTMGVLINFSLLAACGVYFRRRPDVHKRLMLLASINLIGPALGRLPGLQAFPTIYAAGYLSIFLALPLYDIVCTRRVHRATAWGLPLSILVFLLIGKWAGSDAGRAFIDSLR